MLVPVCEVPPKLIFQNVSLQSQRRLDRKLVKYFSLTYYHGTSPVGRGLYNDRRWLSSCKTHM